MLCKRIIPCLDLKDGRVVKGIRFQDLRDAGDPAEQAETYYHEGADEIVCLDVSASREKRGPSLRAIESIASRVFIPLTVGGGISTLSDVRDTLLAGADRVSLNTPAVKNPSLISEVASRYGVQCVVVAIDFRFTGAGADDSGGPWEVFTHGGSRPTGLDLIDWARRAADLGAGELLLTSMDHDGTTAGYAIAATRAVAETVGIPVIASGGAGGPEHIALALTEGRAAAALGASVFHYRTHSIRAIKEYLRSEGVAVR